MRKTFLFLLFLSGCSKVEHPKTERNFEIISEKEYQRCLGYNAAVGQFGTKDMLIDLSNKKVADYTSESEEENVSIENDPYANGYHSALDRINRTSICPR